MSDSDTGDDGGIDKEALRKELREKYEQDERERESARRMSDLLLKGATMTSNHCGTCGDPLFEHDGTTFCPSCHGSPEAVSGADLEESSTTMDPQSAGEPPQPTEPERPPRRQSPVDEGQTDESSSAEHTRQPSSSRGHSEESIIGESGGQPASGTAGTAAHQSLQQALERFAQDAATADDPRYAKECLEAAREAAETLRALR